MSKKNLVLVILALVLIPTSAFAATITESVMNIDPNFINLLKLLFVLGSIAAIIDSYIKDALVGKLNAQIKALKETAVLNNEAHKETRTDARIAWEEVEKLRAQNERLQNRLNVTTDDLIEAEANLHNTSAALVRAQDANYAATRTIESLNGDVQWNKDQAQSLANTANNNAKLANELMQKLQDLNQI
jgi:hypothetical protein